VKETPYVDGWPVAPLPKNMAKTLAKHTSDPILGCIIVNGGVEALVVTETRVYTMMGGFTVKVNAFDRSSITGVEVSVGAMTGDLVVLMPGYTGVPRGANASQIANGVHFYKASLTDVNAIADKIRQPAAAAADPMEQLAKLAQLRDAGVITREEFEAKKSALLERI